MMCLWIFPPRDIAEPFALKRLTFLYSKPSLLHSIRESSQDHCQFFTVKYILKRRSSNVCSHSWTTQLLSWFFFPFQNFSFTSNNMVWQGLVWVKASGGKVPYLLLFPLQGNKALFSSKVRRWLLWPIPRLNWSRTPGKNRSCPDPVAGDGYIQCYVREIKKNDKMNGLKGLFVIALMTSPKLLCKNHSSRKRLY